MAIRKKGNKYEVSYRCKGYKTPFYESFETRHSAELRQAQIAIEKKLGVFQPPQLLKLSNPTVAELMSEYVELYGLNHWGDSYLSSSQHRINDYIIPIIGDVRVRDITPHFLETYYNTLQKTPAKVPKGQPDHKRMVSFSVIEKIHCLLRSAFNQAIRWNYLETNPADTAMIPQYEKHTREVWEPDVALKALSVCREENLHLAISLALGCSMRIGEILALTWDCIDLRPESVENHDAQLFVNKELKRCQKNALEKLEAKNRSKVILKFPGQKDNCTTVVVLKLPKTDSSIRRIYIPDSIVAELLATKKRQEEAKKQLGPEYHEYGLVIAYNNGNPWSESVVKNKLTKLAKDHDLPAVVFHSLRHCSTSMKLELSQGNIKAVQGDTGHAQANMVTDVYAHANNTERKKLAQLVEQQFFNRLTEPAASPISNVNEKIVQFLNSKPEMADTLLALLQTMAV